MGQEVYIDISVKSLYSRNKKREQITLLCGISNNFAVSNQTKCEIYYWMANFRWPVVLHPQGNRTQTLREQRVSLQEDLMMLELRKKRRVENFYCT